MREREREREEGRGEKKIGRKDKELLVPRRERREREGRERERAWEGREKKGKGNWEENAAAAEEEVMEKLPQRQSSAAEKREGGCLPGSGKKEPQKIMGGDGGAVSSLREGNATFSLSVRNFLLLHFLTSTQCIKCILFLPRKKES